GQSISKIDKEESHFYFGILKTDEDLSFEDISSTKWYPMKHVMVQDEVFLSEEGEVVFVTIDPEGSEPDFHYYYKVFEDYIFDYRYWLGMIKQTGLKKRRRLDG